MTNTIMTNASRTAPALVLSLTVTVMVIVTLALAMAPSSPAAAEASGTPVGAVRLPLDEYLQLKEKARQAAERAEDEADDGAPVVVEARITDAVMHEVDAEAGGDGSGYWDRSGDRFGDTAAPRARAEVRSEYLLVVRGPLEEPVDLSYGGSLTRVEVRSAENGEPPRRAGVQRGLPGVLQFYAAEPGRYTVTLHGEVDIYDPLRPAFSWPASSAARDLLRLELPAAATWTSDAPILRDQLLRDERRRLDFSIPPGRPFSVELQPRADAITRDALVRTTLVTLADLDDDGLRLQDAVVYRVLRGAIGSHALTVPPGRSLLRDVSTDEGTQRTDSEVRRLELERQRLLGPGAETSEIGHVLVPYEEIPLSAAAAAGTSADRVPIPPPEIDVAPQARYLVLGSTVAAELLPLPAVGWRRVDLGDLPDAVRSMVSALEPSGVWQRVWGAGEVRSGADDPSALGVRRLPPADALDGLVWSRATTTVLTVDGSLVHRDVYEVQLGGSAFPVRLPGRASLWSTSVDGTPVRALEESGRLLIPVGFRRDAKVRIEVVSVEQQAIEKGRSEIRFDAPSVTVPVLAHEWRLLLPESARYRVDESVLDMASGNAFVASSPVLPVGFEGTGMAGRVVLDGDGSPLPGATVTLSGEGTTRVQISGADGVFHFLPLRPGDYRLVASLEGFGTLEHSLTVRPGKIASPVLALGVDVAAETIVVTSESPQLEPGQFNYRMDQWRSEGASRRRKAEAGRVLEDLQGLLTAGVKPLPVSIPESGKVVTLSGALPPEEIWVTVDVRKR